MSTVHQVSSNFHTHSTSNKSAITPKFNPSIDPIRLTIHNQIFPDTYLILSSRGFLTHLPPIRNCGKPDTELHFRCLHHRSRDKRRFFITIPYHCERNDCATHAEDTAYRRAKESYEKSFGLAIESDNPIGVGRVTLTVPSTFRLAYAGKPIPGSRFLCSSDHADALRRDGVDAVGEWLRGILRIRKKDRLGIAALLHPTGEDPFHFKPHIEVLYFMCHITAEGALVRWEDVDLIQYWMDLRQVLQKRFTETVAKLNPSFSQFTNTLPVVRIQEPYYTMADLMGALTYVEKTFPGMSSWLPYHIWSYNGYLASRCKGKFLKILNPGYKVDKQEPEEICPYCGRKAQYVGAKIDGHMRFKSSRYPHHSMGLPGNGI